MKNQGRYRAQLGLQFEDAANSRLSVLTESSSLTMGLAHSILSFAFHLHLYRDIIQDPVLARRDIRLSTPDAIYVYGNKLSIAEMKIGLVEFRCKKNQLTLIPHNIHRVL